MNFFFSLVVFLGFFSLSNAQIDFQVSKISKTLIAKPLTIKIQTNLPNKTSYVIPPDSNTSFYPLEWISQKITTDEKKWIIEYRFRCFAFEDSTQLSLPFQVVNGNDTINKMVNFPIVYFPKTLSAPEIEKGLYVEDQFLSIPFHGFLWNFLIFTVLIISILILIFVFLKNPLIRWISLQKLKNKQQKWLTKAEIHLNQTDWIVEFVKQNKEYLEQYTAVKLTSLTPHEIEKLTFPELFQPIKTELIQLCHDEYLSEFSGKTLDINSKELANRLLKKMEKLFEMERKQLRDL